MKAPRFYSSRRACATRGAFRSIAATGLSLLSLTEATQAANDFWTFSGTANSPLPTTATTGGGTANYDDGPAGYWNLGVKPTNTANNAVIDNGGTVNITTNQTPVDIIVGSQQGGSGTFNQTAGTVSMTFGWFRLGFTGQNFLQPQSTYNLSGGALSMTAGTTQQFNVGEAQYSNVAMTVGGGTGAATVSGNFGQFFVGGGPNSVGSLTLNANSTFNFNPTAAPATGNTTVSIGNTGTGTLNVQGGTLNVQPTINGNYALVFGRNSGSTGTLNLSSGTVNVGGNAAGSTGLNQELWLSAGTGSTGTVNMTGGTLNVTSWLAIGRGGNNGTFNMSGGVVNAAINAGFVSGAGQGATAVGTTNLFGGTFNTPNGMYVTEGGTGSLNISGTAVMNIPGAVGLRVNTTASTNTVAVGTVNLGDGFTPGGVLSVSNVNSTNTNAANSIFNFQGGTLQAKAANANFFVVGQANVGDLGAIIDSNGVNIGITQPLLHSLATTGTTDGGLTKVGTGVLTLTGANTYTGPTNVTAGTLALTGAGSIGTSTLINPAAGATLSLSVPTTFSSSQTLTGRGTVAGGANNLTIGGILAPGVTEAVGSVGTLVVSTMGTLTLASTAVYQFDVLTAMSKDLVNAPGAALSVAGTLAVQGTVSAGTTYTLFSGLASETGNFNSVTGVPTSLTPTFSFLGGNYNVTFAAVPEPSTWALGVFGLGSGALWLRRRRVAA